MSTYMKPGQPWLYDETTGDIVGVKDADGGDSFFARTLTDANGVTNLILADGSQILLLNGDTGSASGVAFSVPTGYTVGTAATALDLTNLLVDTNSAIVDLADNSFLVPSDATHFRAFVHVLFAANATGHRYVAVEQYFQTIATWTAVSGAYMELAALGGGKATTVSFNTPYMACGASFPKMRIAVGQDSGGALNCTPIGATFEFLR